MNVAIDRSGKWWIGSEAADIEGYLKAYEAEGYAVHETHPNLAAMLIFGNFAVFCAGDVSKGY